MRGVPEISRAKKRVWQNRAHFLAICAQLMRRILVDYARRRHYPKRGGGTLQVTLAEALTNLGQLSGD